MSALDLYIALSIFFEKNSCGIKIRSFDQPRKSLHRTNFAS